MSLAVKANGVLALRGKKEKRKKRFMNLEFPFSLEKKSSHVGEKSNTIHLDLKIFLWVQLTESNPRLITRNS